MVLIRLIRFVLVTDTLPIRSLLIKKGYITDKSLQQSFMPHIFNPLFSFDYKKKIQGNSEGVKSLTLCGIILYLLIFITY